MSKKKTVVPKVRKCEYWNPLSDSIVQEVLAEYKPVGSEFDVIHTSPGYCSQNKVNTEHYVQVASECICYTCPKNTIPLGQGFNGQGA